MKRQTRAALLLAFLSMLPVAAGSAAELRGSMASMRKQHAVAKQNRYTFLRTSAQVREFVRADKLVRVSSNSDVLVKNISFPYARQPVKLFIERLAEQFHAATGERLVVTSLTRPLSRQPRNAHALSVHPAGMAVDFRVPRKANARRWLERTLLALENRGLVDATRERRPPHYHVAVYPEKYTEYVVSVTGDAEAVAEVVATPLQVVKEPTVVASLEPTDSSGHDAPGDTVRAEPHRSGVAQASVFAITGAFGLTWILVLAFAIRRTRSVPQV